MSPEEKQSLIDAIGKTIVDEVQRALGPMQKQLDRLELRFEAAEMQVREYRFAGVWTERSVYKKGNTVQHAGSTWHCNIDGISTMPSSDHIGWTLQAKRGQDAPGVRA